MPSIRTPKYRHNKFTGRALVTLSGRDVYLGDYSSEDSKARHARLLRSTPVLPELAFCMAERDRTVAATWSLCAAFAKE